MPKLYEIYHKNVGIQKKIILENNFTYRNLFSILRKNEILSKRKRILDIGCGVGTVDFFLASKGNKVVGIDISSTAIKAAIQSSKELGLDKQVHFICGNFPTSKISGQYDLILMSEVLEHLKNDQDVLRVIKRFLKRDGILVLSVPSKNAPLFRLGLLKEFDREVGHLRRYRLNHLRKLLSSNKMKIEEYYKTEGALRNFLFTNNFANRLVRFLKGPLSDIMAWFDNLTIPIFGESQIYIIASKK